MRRLLTICALSILACANVHALDGDADPSFGDGGQVTIKRPQPLTPTGSEPTGDLSLLADGRYLWASPLTDGGLWIGRAFHDGTPDASFGTDGSGHVTLTDCTAPSAANLVAEADGGVVVWTGACLLRLHPDGSIDTTFGAGPQPAAGLMSAGLARDARGRYVLAGSSIAQASALTRAADDGGDIPTGTPTRNWLIYRFDANGAADASFGDAGKVDVDVPASNDWRELRAIAVRADGRIVTAGMRQSDGGVDLVVVQLQEDGSLDPSWNMTGILDIPPPTDYQTLQANALALDADGSLIVAGYGSRGSVGCCLLLARFDVAGQLVADFGLRLFALAGMPDLFQCCAEQRDAVTLLPNHRIIVATSSISADLVSAHRIQYTLVRTFADGEVDPSFGHGGWNSFTIADPDAIGQSGDYNQLHAAVYDAASDSMLILGRTFFEDNSTGDDYVSFVRSRFDLIFADGLDR